MVEKYVMYINMKFISSMVGNWLGGILFWEYCWIFKEEWDGFVILKGIFYLEDVFKVVEIGLDGIVVFNYGVW